MATFNCPALPERFEFLSQLGKVFLIEPEILKSYITESSLSRIDLHLLRPYLAQRADWATFERAFDGQTAAGGVDMPAVNGFGFSGSGGSDGRGLGERLGMPKLSTMMRELEGMRIDTMASNLGSFNFTNRFNVHSGSG